MAKDVDISSSEWQVMNVVWRIQPVTASQIIQELAEPHSWSAATIRTFLHRLVKKGALTFETEGNRYRYRAAIARQPLVQQASRSFLKSVFGGQAAPMLTHLVESQPLSAEEIQHLRALLDQKEQQS